MAVLVLNEAERRKLDSSDDTLFYAEPRFVQHLDGAFRRRLTALYRERIPLRGGAGSDEQLGESPAGGHHL